MVKTFKPNEAETVLYTNLLYIIMCRYCVCVCVRACVCVTHGVFMYVHALYRDNSPSIVICSMERRADEDAASLRDAVCELQ